MSMPMELDPAPLLASTREQFVSFDYIANYMRDQDSGARLVPRAAAEDFAAMMSDHLATQVRNYEATGDLRLVLLRYSVSKDGHLQAVLDGGLEPPSAEDLVHFSTSTSVADSGALSVTAEELICSRIQQR